MKNRIKIAFLGAGSTIFAKNVIGDCMFKESLRDAHFALYDIDKERMAESYAVISTINKNINDNRAHITFHLSEENRIAALSDADFVINAINVGGYDPATITDFKIPAKYGLKQTIGDTMGVAGIFRGLRTIPVLLDFIHELEEIAPSCVFLNYTNPMSIITGALLKASPVKTVGLCHSNQVCVESLFETLGWDYQGRKNNIIEHIAGINHMGWLLKITENGQDLYPEIKEAASVKLDEWRDKKNPDEKHKNMVRLEVMRKFGYYVTESSEHCSEYMPYWIKSRYPELIAEYNIPIDEYLHRCIRQRRNWETQFGALKDNPALTHELSVEYAAGIMDAIVTHTPYRIGGNVLNNGLISNLPADAVVEVPCLVDGNGIQGTYVGELPEQCAALNLTNVNMHLLAIKAALSRKKEDIYQAAMLDPHTSSELKIDDIVQLCDDLIAEHGNLLPHYC